jgi:hypothetical protein
MPKGNEARLERERHNVDDAASFLVELGRLGAVDEWEQGRIVEIRAEGERRRHEHRQVGAAAVSRMLDRGETLTAIAELAGVKVSDVRAVLKSAVARLVSAPDALGAPYATTDAAGAASCGDTPKFCQSRTTSNHSPTSSSKTGFDHSRFFSNETSAQ